MTRVLRLLACLALVCTGLVGAPAVHAEASERARQRREAAGVTIVRDDWGVAHVHGATDALAVFGMIYAQAEDDFGRIESNYLEALGRTAEVEGGSAIWRDLRQRLFVDPSDLQARYAASPVRLRALMRAWADGLNYYLATHPRTRPRRIARFEPWMALSFTEGSIGGDITKVSLDGLRAFYDRAEAAPLARLEEARLAEPTGSNGVAIAPSLTEAGHALLLINPHTTFFFRSELQVSSDEGLNAYGAATWGQFFIYQGFNAHAGWMHTTSSADTVDEFAETIVRGAGGLKYRYGAVLRPVTARRIDLEFKRPDGGLGRRSFRVLATRHGPIVRAADGKWMAVALMNKPVEALEQSFERTKAVDLAGFMKVAALRANSSNDTLFADDRGETALLLPQFVPLRDDRFDYTRPVDGADPATDWKGDTPLDQLPRSVNPAGGWLYNSNDGPWWASGADSPRRAAFPRYMDQVGENPRTGHAVRVLAGHGAFTLQSLIDAAFDPYLPPFARLTPRLVAAYDALPATDPRKLQLREPMATLRAWDFRWSATSIPTSLAVLWGDTLLDGAPAEARGGLPALDYIADGSTAAEKLEALVKVVARLSSDFGDWRVPWGELNRFQRLDDGPTPTFDDAAPSVPVPFTSAQWGSLASFGAKRPPGSRRYYGTSGNSFVAVVEFGPRVRARAVTAGGESGDPASPHFRDQASRYAGGDLREVYFHPDQLSGHTERRYHPGSGGRR